MIYIRINLDPITISEYIINIIYFLYKLMIWNLDVMVKYGN